MVQPFKFWLSVFRITKHKITHLGNSSCGAAIINRGVLIVIWNKKSFILATRNNDVIDVFSSFSVEMSNILFSKASRLRCVCTFPDKFAGACLIFYSRWLIYAAPKSKRTMVIVSQIFSIFFVTWLIYSHNGQRSCERRQWSSCLYPWWWRKTFFFFFFWYLCISLTKSSRML